MKILVAHNFYLLPGGEDTVFESDVCLLKENGHEVIEYIEDNHRIKSMNRFLLAINTLWSSETYIKMTDLLVRKKPDVVQFYNTFPLVSPSAYHACRQFNIPVIQYLFNPRLICPAATLYRKGNLCTDCLAKDFPWPGVLHACYHNSRAQTAVIALMLFSHRFLKTWSREVDYYLSATRFYRDLYIQGGLPPEKVLVKTNYISRDPGISDFPGKGGYALFIARLDPEKGVKTMLDAWRSLSIPLKIRGSGQLEDYVRGFTEAHGMNQVEFVERLGREKLVELRRGARFLVWPSEGYYETFGLAAVECFAQGIPVIASNIGVMQEIVRDGETGLLFEPGNPADLAAKAQWLWDHPEECIRMGHNARREYEEKYTPERNYQMLMQIYEKALAMRA